MLSSSGWSLRTPTVLTRFVVFTALSLALMVLDHRGQHLAKIRAGLSVVFYPIEVAATLPARAVESFLNFVGGNEALQQKYDKLASRQPLLEAKLERYDALVAQNTHLRKLLGSAALVADRAVVAKILQVSEEPFTRKIVIARGSLDGVHDGQPVIDNHGIMGQVTEVDPEQSRVTLITDPGHAIPVEDTRNGLRAIVFGTGAESSVAVRYLAAPTDIKVGDLLVSSGIGGTFPFGYPVARVTRIVNNPNEPFLNIHARPVAHLEYNKEVLLIWPTKITPGRTLPPASAPGPQPTPLNGVRAIPDTTRRPPAARAPARPPAAAADSSAGADHGH